MTILADGPCDCYPEPGYHPCGCGEEHVRFWLLSSWHKAEWSPPVHLDSVHWRLECVLRLARKALGQGALEDVRREVAAARGGPKEEPTEQGGLFA